MRKKVLIITYYWPPAGGGGVQRWLKFSKYFRDFGWDPIIYTADGGELPAVDHSLVDEIPSGVTVLKTPIWEPYAWYKKFTGKKQEEKVYSGFISEGKGTTFTQKIAVFIRGNFFIPDARMFWIQPSVRFLKSYLKDNPVDAIVSTGPPHSMHRIALFVKAKCRIPWVADFRDPWTNIDFYDKLHLTFFADHRHRRMEREVLKGADKIVTVSWSWARDFEKLSGRSDIEIITNGFDLEDFGSTQEQLDKDFSICHVGSMNSDRNPLVLWKVLAELCLELPDFKEKLKIRLIGNVDFSIVQAIESFGLVPQLETLSFMPHNEAILFLKKSQVLLLPINDTPNSAGVLPGKLYEYMGAKRPILCVGPPEQDAGRILRETESGQIFDYHDFSKLKTTLLSWFAAYQKGSLHVDSNSIGAFSRRSLAGDYASLLDALVKKH